ncbi:MAG: NTP transferase domain-containing protein [Bauldia sp.]|nr:NTP transferase domain-containing protein [Bauldia sp.]
MARQIEKAGENRVAGVVLAGGEGKRIGGGKPFRALLGRPLIGHVIDRISPQVDKLWLSARQGSDQLARFGLPVVEDSFSPLGRGPLAGIVSAMDAAAGEGFDALAVFPCDVPFLPGGLVGWLAGLLDRLDAPGVVVSSAGRLHPTIGLWRVEARRVLGEALRDGHYRLKAVFDAAGAIAIDCAEGEIGPDCLFNVNTVADLSAAELLGRDNKRSCLQ